VLITANGGQRFVVRVSLAIGAAGRSAAMVPTPLPVETAVSPAVPQPARPQPGFSEVGSGFDQAAPPQKARPLPPPRTPVRKRAARPAAAGNPERSNTTLYLLIGGGAGLLLLLLLGVFLLLPSSQEPKKVAVVVEGGGEENPKPKGGAGNNQAVIEDEKEEVIPTKAGAVTFKIDDEPEERTGKAPPPQPVKVQIKDEDPVVLPGKGGPAAAVDPEPRVIYQYGNNMRFGITALKDSSGNPLNKRITFSADGGTSNTRIKVNGVDGEYGEPSGRWEVRGQNLPDDPPRNARNRTLSVLAVGNLRISQLIEVVPNKQPVMVGGVPKRVLDTVLVRYQIENKDKRAHSVGLRVHVDTLIGSNDGVPFTVPGQAGLVNTFADFRTRKQVPEFIQALEVPNLQNPGTVANMTLKLGGGLEPPARVSLTHWPGGGAGWEVPVRHMQNDSAVIIYWNPRSIKPGQKRQFGYAYGLGRVDAGEGRGQLGITVGGEFDPGKVFTVVAQVHNPVPNQSLTLDVPKGLEVQPAPNPRMVRVPPGKGTPPTSVVTWNVKVLETGDFRITVRSSTGVSQSKTISITRPEAPTGGKLALELQGASFEPGQVFTVLARVTDPVPGQTLKLGLPRDLNLVEGAKKQPVPPAAAPGGVSTVSWKARIIYPGQFKIRVESSTGVAQTKTLTIVRQELTGGAFRLALSGDFAPGKVFTVQAVVSDPQPGQALTLKLPPKLERVKGDERQGVPPVVLKGSSTGVSWAVKVQEAGKYTVGVESTTGIIQRKTLTILPANAGKFVLEFSGTIAPGKEFLVIARVTNPVKDQQLTLKLPEKLKLVEGAETQGVDPPAGPTGLVRWKVRVEGGGRLPVRVECPTIGAARTSTITITEAKDKGSGGIF
jgi:hypothetical protein